MAEIQQSSDATWRLFDWNRLGPDGKPRQLHVEQALDAIDYAVGPVSPAQPEASVNSPIERLATSDKFILDRLRLSSPRRVEIDDRFHILAVLSGRMSVSGDPGPRPLGAGDTMLLPASRPATELIPLPGAIVLDAYLP